MDAREDWRYTLIHSSIVILIYLSIFQFAARPTRSTKADTDGERMDDITELVQTEKRGTVEGGSCKHVQTLNVTESQNAIGSRKREDDDSC